MPAIATRDTLRSYRRERRALRDVEAEIRCTDPGLASMIAIFSRLAVDEDMPAYERGPRATARVLGATLAAAAAVIRLVARVTRACVRRLRSPRPARSVPYLPPGKAWPSQGVYLPWYWYR